MLPPAVPPLLPLRTLRPGQRSQVYVVDLDQDIPRLVHDTDLLLEASNWAPDGNGVLLNGAGCCCASAWSL
jgi:TolB protein